MDGITDAPMRALQGEVGSFSFAVSEFLRVSTEVLPAKVFRREVPEVGNGGFTPSGLPVQVQILGGDPALMAMTAVKAVAAGARAIDINFGCPAPTVNRNDGGATLLNHPCRIRTIVSEVRSAVPAEIPVSAKIRLGWSCIEQVHENAAMAEEGGASWLTIHARTRAQGYAPPVFWKSVGAVRRSLEIPVVANGDIFTFEDFLRCREETGCSHFMIGRGALASPSLSCQIANELGLPARQPVTDWPVLLGKLLEWTERCGASGVRDVHRSKQWLAMARRHGEFNEFDRLKRIETVGEFFQVLESLPAAA